MSAASDKARFHLERSVPELREWERRGVFTRAEIASITRKRSDFEHTLAGRGTSTPAVYARYLAYEMNLDALRHKRVQRLSLRTTRHSGQQRIFSILERATRKHHGDLALWMQYLEYCRRQGARKKLQRVLTECVRMFPTTAEVWIWAGRWEMDGQGDVGAMRGWMQRGLRFCPASRDLWVEYARMEMLFVAKIVARGRILGLDVSEGMLGAQKEIEEGKAVEPDDEDEADIIPLPGGEDELEKGGMPMGALEKGSLEKLDKTPAATGAIPRAIFDAAVKQFKGNDAVAAAFFGMFAEFTQTPCMPAMLQHVLDSTIPAKPTSHALWSCKCRQPLVGVEPTSPEFPAALREALKRIKEARNSSTSETGVAAKILDWVQPLSEEDSLSPELHAVLQSTVRQLQKVAQSDG